MGCWAVARAWDPVSSVGVLIFAPIVLVVSMALCIPAWKSGKKENNPSLLDYLTLILPVPAYVLLLLTGFTHDDDGAPSTGACLLLPFAAVVVTYLRVFAVNRLTSHSRATSIVAFVLATIVFPIVYGSTVYDYDKCQHCDGDECLTIGCGG
jgi:hypothetical protein